MKNGNGRVHQRLQALEDRMAAAPDPDPDQPRNGDEFIAWLRRQAALGDPGGLIAEARGRAGDLERRLLAGCDNAH